MKITTFALLVLLTVTSCTNSDIETIETVITASDFFITLDENPDNNQVLGTIEATTNQGTLSYSMSTQSPEGAMAIHSQTGEIYVLDASLFNYDTNPQIAGTVKIENGDFIKNVLVTVTLTEVIELSLQERLDNGETPFDIYNSDNSLLIALYGLTYQGGLIFYLDIINGNGMIAAPNDQSTGAEWGCEGTNIAGAEYTSIGSGLQNTIEIINLCSTPGIAAEICYTYTLDGYDDWYLPSKDELNLMYTHLKINGFGNFSDDWYWSSTEFEDQANYNNFGYEAAWVQSFEDGYQATYDVGIKKFENSVRAIRNF